MKSVAATLLPFLKFIYFTTFCITAFVLPATAQFNLKLIVTDSSELHKSDTVFVAGNFNNWNPGNNTYHLTRENNKLVIELKNISARAYEFKFTRGDWAKVAYSSSGIDLGNYLINISSDTTLYFTIQAWKDDFVESVAKKHTASKNVKILDSAFFIPQLNRYRSIMIYLPEGYEKSSKRYPVLYMHDGQNLFDESSSAYGEWGVDECLDTLIKNGKKACIVVAIANSAKRMNEYSPFYNEEVAEPEGDAYINFIVETLKPYIDKEFKTIINKENTIIAGSSMGGLISYYAMLKHPDVFGKAGIFSPSFWISKEINHFTDSLANKMNGMLFFYIGGMEGEKYKNDMLNISDTLAKSSNTFIYSVIDEKGMHNEQAWRKWFAEFYLWITEKGNNYIIKTFD